MQHRTETQTTAAVDPALQRTCVLGLGLPSPHSRVSSSGWHSWATCPKRQGEESRITSPSKFTESENNISFQSGPMYQKHSGRPAAITEECKAATAPTSDALKVTVGPVTFSPPTR